MFKSQYFSFYKHIRKFLNTYVRDVILLKQKHNFFGKIIKKLEEKLSYAQIINVLHL